MAYLWVILGQLGVFASSFLEGFSGVTGALPGTGGASPLRMAIRLAPAASLFMLESMKRSVAAQPDKLDALRSVIVEAACRAVRPQTRYGFQFMRFILCTVTLSFLLVSRASTSATADEVLADGHPKLTPGSTITVIFPKLPPTFYSVFQK